EVGAVHLLEIDELAGRAHYRDRHAPIVLLRLGHGGGGDGFGLLVGDGRTIVGRRLLREGAAAERERRADAERDQELSSHGPASKSSRRRSHRHGHCRRGVMMLSKIRRLLPARGTVVAGPRWAGGLWHGFGLISS